MSLNLDLIALANFTVSLYLDLIALAKLKLLMDKLDTLHVGRLIGLKFMLSLHLDQIAWAKCSCTLKDDKFMTTLIIC